MNATDFHLNTSSVIWIKKIIVTLILACKSRNGNLLYGRTIDHAKIWKLNGLNCYGSLTKRDRYLRNFTSAVSRWPRAIHFFNVKVRLENMSMMCRGCDIFHNRSEIVILTNLSCLASPSLSYQCWDWFWYRTSSLHCLPLSSSCCISCNLHL